MGHVAAALSTLPLFEGCKADTLLTFSDQLERRPLDPGTDLMRQGDAADFFAIVVAGELTVVRRNPDGTERVARAGPGSVIGELALLRNQPRTATVTANRPGAVVVGGTDAFAALLDLPDMPERLRDVVARRLAEDLRPVDARLPAGGTIQLRPLLPSDRQEFTAAVRELSEETLRKRFFTGGVPSQRLINYLVDVNYIDHFAWLAIDPVGDEGVGVGRYVRAHDEARSAEVAITAIDAWQGRGVGTLLLGALGAAGIEAGLERFTAQMLADNQPIQAVLRKASAEFHPLEPGVLGAELPVAGAAGILDVDLRRELQRATGDIVTAAGLALAR